MRDPLPFTFGIALVPRALTQNWALIEALLDLTLTSVRAQTDPDFRVIIACHDRPRTVMDDDPRLSVLVADWPVRETGPHNDDSGRKKHALNDYVLEQGGGLLMFVDADDWIDRETVAAARACIGLGEVGGLITAGMILDIQSLRIAALPHPDIFPGEFHRLCGTSTVACLRPDSADPVRRDPFSTLRSHHQWLEVAQERDVRLARLPISANYLVNTSENHSDLHGPHLAWRRTLTAAVNAQGRCLGDAQAACFGIDTTLVSSTWRRFFPPSPDSVITA
jgi:hypothetical protein